MMLLHRLLAPCRISAGKLVTKNMGFTPDIIEQMPEVPGIAPPHARLQEEPPHITWGSLLSGDRSPAQCVAFIDNLITTASAKHAQVCAKHLCSLRQARLQLLRDGEVSKMRPAQPASSSYSPDWVTTLTGGRCVPPPLRKCFWGLQEPSCCWAHPVVLPSVLPTTALLSPAVPLI